MRRYETLAVPRPPECVQLAKVELSKLITPLQNEARKSWRHKRVAYAVISTNDRRGRRKLSKLVNLITDHRGIITQEYMVRTLNELSPYTDMVFNVTCQFQDVAELKTLSITFESA